MMAALGGVFELVSAGRPMRVATIADTRKRLASIVKTAAKAASQAVSQPAAKPAPVTVKNARAKTAEKAAQYATHIQRLEDRVQVLERIVTDRGYDIATQIEALRDTRLETVSGPHMVKEEPDVVARLLGADELAALEPRLAQVVELRYFGGLSELEIADVLKVTERTVRRDWRKARAFLFSHLGEGELPEQW